MTRSADQPARSWSAGRLASAVRSLLPAGGFARGVVTLSGATAISQLVTVAALPVLTRLYDPHAFGVAGAYAGMIGLVVVVATFRYELAIPLPRSDRGGLHVAAISLFALLFIAIVAGLAAPFVFSQWVGEETGLSSSAFAALVVVGTLTAGAYAIANYWAVRKSRFGVIARTRIQQGVAGAGTQLALGFAGFGALGLILGQIIGQCAGLIRLAANMAADNRRTGARIHRHGLAWAASRYRRFPLYDSWAGLLNVAGAQAPVLLFAALFSPVLAGYYALSVRLLSAPLSLVGKAVSQVLLPRIVEAGRRGEAAQLVLRLINILAWLSFVPFTIVALTAQDLVPKVFGSEWAPAAMVVSWTAIWAAFQFVTSPLSVVMIGLEALRLHTVVQFILFALRVGAILVGASMESQTIAVIGFALASVAGYVVYLLAIGFTARVGLTQIPGAIGSPILLSVGCVVVFLGVSSTGWLTGYAAILSVALVWLLCLRSRGFKGFKI